MCEVFKYTTIFFHAVGVIEISKDAEVTCVIKSFNDVADLSAEDDDLVTVATLVNRGYKVTKIDWNREFTKLEKAEEFISLKNMRFCAKEDELEEIRQEYDFEEMLDDDVGDDRDRNVGDDLEKLQD